MRYIVCIKFILKFDLNLYELRPCLNLSCSEYEDELGVGDPYYIISCVRVCVRACVCVYSGMKRVKSIL